MISSSSVLASRRERGIKRSGRCTSIRTCSLHNFFVGFLIACISAGTLFPGSIPSCQGNDKSEIKTNSGSFDETATTDSAYDFAVLTIDDLDEGIADLRYGDQRLIRYNVPSEEAEERQEEFCSKHLETLFLMLSTRFNVTKGSVPLNIQTKVVQLLTLCSSEHPEFRQQIGSFNDSIVLRAILSMLEEGDPSIHAVVGEAIWILSFNNEHNHSFLTTNHAIAKIASTFVESTKDLESDEISDDDKAAYTLAIMWIAAALQNLAASYCATDSGHCWWEYGVEDNEEVGEEGGLYLNEESPLVIDGSGAAEFIAKFEGGELANILQMMVCAEPMTEEDEEFWPSVATIDSALNAASDSRLATWAAGGLLKNLSMYTGSRDVPQQSQECLCALMQSEDWLESSKAEDALFRLGIQEEDCGEYGDYDEEDHEDEEDESDEL